MADAPPPFFGVHTEDAETWFRGVEWWLQTKRAADDRARIAFVAGMLRDSARSWFHALPFAAVDAPAQEPGLRTFADFKEAFQVRYRRDATNEWRDQAALWSMSQGATESVEHFIAAVEVKAVTARATPEQVKGAVINGLRQQLKAAVLNHEIRSLDDVKKWALVAEDIAATSLTAPMDMTSAFKKLEDSLNQKFEQIQLRALGDAPQAARRQASPTPRPSEPIDHFYPADRRRDPTFPAQGHRDGRQRYPSPPPDRYQQQWEQHDRYPRPPPPPHRYEQQQARHTARQEDYSGGQQRYGGRRHGAAHGGGHQAQGAHDFYAFECCGRCGRDHGNDECPAFTATCRRCLRVGHYSRKCLTRGPQGRHFDA